MFNLPCYEFKNWETSQQRWLWGHILRSTTPLLSGDRFPEMWSGVLWTSYILTCAIKTTWGKIWPYCGENFAAYEPNSSMVDINTVPWLTFPSKNPVSFLKLTNYRSRNSQLTIFFKAEIVLLVTLSELLCQGNFESKSVWKVVLWIILF